jgi:F0F1-type ATP synthase assembly protein I
MSDRGNEAVTNAQQEAAAQGRAQGLETGWTVFSYLLAGMAAYGIIGWLIGRAVHVPVLFPLGMLLGLGISIAYIIHRFGRQQRITQPRVMPPRGHAAEGHTAKGHAAEDHAAKGAAATEGDYR